MAFRPIISGTGLAEYEVIRAKQLTKWACTDAVHCAWLKIHEDSTRHITSSCSFVKINIDTFELEVGIAMVGAGRIDAMLIRYDFPELRSNLVAALTTLDVNELTHDD